MDVLLLCADELTHALSNANITSDVILTNVPRRRHAIVKYGIDHSAELAKAVAERIGAKYMPILSSRAKIPQKNLDGVERFKNASFEVKHDHNLKGKRVVIIDDVITTGASMAAAGSLIRSLGATDIIGAALAIVYKDDE